MLAVVVNKRGHGLIAREEGRGLKKQQTEQLELLGMWAGDTTLPCRPPRPHLVALLKV